jgi:hypothetical protein
MVSIEEIQAAYYMVAATGVLVAAVYYVMNIRSTQRNLKLNLETRQAQLFMDIYKTYSSKEYQKDREQMGLIWSFTDYEDFFKKYGPQVDPDEHAKWDTQLAMYAGIGVLIKRGMISPDLVFDLIYDTVIAFWEKFSIVVEGLRKGYQRADGKFMDYYLPNYMQDAEFLYDEMRRIAKERGSPTPNWSGKRLPYAGVGNR